MHLYLDREGLALKNIQEAIELYLEVQRDEKHKISSEQITFVGMQEVEIQNWSSPCFLLKKSASFWKMKDLLW